MAQLSADDAGTPALFAHADYTRFGFRPIDYSAQDKGPLSPQVSDALAESSTIASPRHTIDAIVGLAHQLHIVPSSSLATGR